ncbi:MAG: photosynthetic complex assembly protein PuhC [Caulobacterales bacterium]
MSAIDLQPFPRWPLIAAGGLIAISVIFTGIVRIGRIGEPSPAVQVQSEIGAALASRTLTFVNQPDESLIVIDATTGAQIARIAKADTGFIYGVMRGLRRARMIRKAPIDPTVTIAAFADGRMLLTDPAADAVIDLNAFGADNRAVFSRYLAPAQAARTGAPT